MADDIQKIWEGKSWAVEETMALGEAVGGMVIGGDVIALEGELGAGKTQFVRGVAKGMGLDERGVSSPTFVLVHEYDDGVSGRVLVHLDAYRLNGPEDLESIGWDEHEGGFGGDVVVAVEWATRMLDWLGEEVLRVKLRHVSETDREIEVWGQGRWLSLVEELAQSMSQAVGGAAE